MEKRVVLGVFIFLILINSVLFASAFSAAEEKANVARAYTCLENQLSNKDCSQLSLEEALFVKLATGNCSAKIDEFKDGAACWPAGSCNLKTTAQAVLANARTKEDTSDSETWLLSQTTIPTNLIWYLEIDSDNATSCSIEYETGEKYSITIGEDKKISGDAGACLTPSFSNYWLGISENCYDKAFAISCDEAFITTLIFQRKTTTNEFNPYHILKGTQSAKADGRTIERIESYCFSQNGVCDYEGSLWAATVLDYRNQSVTKYLPYLIDGWDRQEHKPYMPAVFLYLLTGNLEYKSQLLFDQNVFNGFWDSNSGDRYFDTGLALWPFYSTTLAEKTKGKEWLFKTQTTDGCWGGNSNDLIYDTSWVLYSVWPQTVRPLCSKDTDCARGKICRDRVCITNLTCATDAECPTGKECINNWCENKINCTSDENCTDGKICRGGFCVKNTTCFKDLDCPYQQICLNGNCTIGSGNCTLDSQCPTGKVCRNGLCTTNVTCLSDFHCPTGKICLNKICVNDTVKCTSNLNCTGGKICKNGACVNGTILTNCTTSLDCPTGQTCLNKKCIIDDEDCATEGFFCMTGTSCNGHILSQYECSAATLKCCDKPKSNQTCASLNGKVCTSSQYCSGTKQATDGLLTGQTCCLTGNCTAKTVTNNSCTKNSECTGGKVCKNKICVSSGTGPTSCESADGFCESSGICGKGYSEDTNGYYECTSSLDICCLKDKTPASKLWLWILLILIVLVVLGIVFREKISAFILRLKTQFGKKKKGPTGPPGAMHPGMPGHPAPPVHPQAYPRTPMRSYSERKVLPPPQRAPMRPTEQIRRPMPQPIKKPVPKSKAELEEVLKKLKEMSK